MPIDTKIRVNTQRRDSFDAPALQTSVTYDGATLVVDQRTLPRELRHLIPTRVGHFAPEEWRPFCVLARTLGIL